MKTTLTIISLLICFTSFSQGNKIAKHFDKEFSKADSAFKETKFSKDFSALESQIVKENQEMNRIVDKYNHQRDSLNAIYVQTFILKWMEANGVDKNRLSNHPDSTKVTPKGFSAIYKN